jgi:hypothetical protein
VRNTTAAQLNLQVNTYLYNSFAHLNAVLCCAVLCCAVRAGGSLVNKIVTNSFFPHLFFNQVSSSKLALYFRFYLKLFVFHVPHVYIFKGAFVTIWTGPENAAQVFA